MRCHIPWMRTAWIAGASGLVGGFLLRELLAAPEYDRVVAFGRRPLELNHPKLMQRITTFTDLNSEVSTGVVDDAFCCLGTTIKQAGSREAFRAVDQTAVVAFAWGAQQHGAKRFFVVSAMGADPESKVFYNRVKGDTEVALQVLDFDTLAIFRPSLLLGSRPTFRLGEKVAAAAMAVLNPLLWGGLRKYRSIQAEVVARAMVRCSFGRGAQGALVFNSAEIQDLGLGGTGVVG
jgi:uncharacterized protein YbjT (DUF2867 family)